MERQLPRKMYGVLVCSHVRSGQRAVKVVTRDGRDWQFVCGKEDHHPSRGWAYVHFEHVLRHHPAVRGLPPLSDGEQAERSTGEYWKVSDARMPQIQEDIANQGFAVMTAEDGESATVGYSVGLETARQHPEICCFGLSTAELEPMLLHMCGLIMAGEELKRYGGTRAIFTNVDVYCIPVPKPEIKRWFPCMVEWHAERDAQFPRVLQLVWPDNARRYPWDARANRKMKRVQPVLGIDSRKTKAWLEQHQQ